MFDEVNVFSHIGSQRLICDWPHHDRPDVGGGKSVNDMKSHRFTIAVKDGGHHAVRLYGIGPSRVAAARLNINVTYGD